MTATTATTGRNDVHDSMGQLADVATSAMQQPALRALEQQAAALGRLRARVADAVDTVPSQTYSGWRGIAAFAFDAALVGLRTDLCAALERLDDAVSDTRQAIATLQGRM